MCVAYLLLSMPYVDDGKESTRYDKISKKKEKALRKKGFKPYDVRYGVSFPRGGKIKVWAKNKDDAHSTGLGAQTNVMITGDSTGHPIEVKPWKKPNHPKTRMKRKDNLRFRQKKITKVHPKTGKKFTQIIYKHSKDWWRH